MPSCAVSFRCFNVLRCRRPTESHTIAALVPARRTALPLSLAGTILGLAKFATPVRRPDRKGAKLDHVRASQRCAVVRARRRGCLLMAARKGTLGDDKNQPSRAMQVLLHFDAPAVSICCGRDLNGYATSGSADVR
jgi:hypothetical protein